MLVLPVAGMVTLTLVLAFYIVVSGIFELVGFARLRRLRGAVWFLVDGLVSLLLLGLIFFHWPWSSLWFIGTLVGISLLLSRHRENHCAAKSAGGVKAEPEREEFAMKIARLPKRPSVIVAFMVMLTFTLPLRGYAIRRRGQPAVDGAARRRRRGGD